MSFQRDRVWWEQLKRYEVYLIAEKNASPYTVRNYIAEAREFLEFLEVEGLRDWSQVDRAVLRRYLAWLAEAGHVKASIARRVSELRSFCCFLVENKWLETNPFASVSSLKTPKRLPKFLSLSEVEALLTRPNLDTPQGQRDRAILEMLYASGIRVGELVRLNLRDLDLHAGQIRVRGKGDKERIALLGRPAIAALYLYLTDGRARLVSKRGTGALFLNRDGGRLTARSVQAMLSRYARQAGITRPVTPHILRHTFATHLLDGGADLRSVQELLGHAQLGTTEIYTHISEPQARRVYLESHPRARGKDDSPS